MTLLPTLNRISLLKKFVDSLNWAETTTPGLIIVDEQDYIKNEKGYNEVLGMIPENWAFTLTKAVKMGDKIREVWQQVLDSGCSWVNLLNDDHVIKTKYWDKKLLQRVDGTNFVTCNDGWMSPAKAAGATIWSMELLKAIDVPIYLPGMQHLFIDDLWENIGRSTGCWDIDHSVLIEHHNQLKTPDQRDSTFYEVYGKGPDMTQNEMWKNDNKIFTDFMQKDYIHVRNKIRKLRGQIEITYNA